MAVHGKKTVVLVNNRNLTRILNEHTVTKTIEAVEATCFEPPGDAREYIAGLREDTLTLSGLFDPSTDGGVTPAGHDYIVGYLGGTTPHVTLGPGGAANGTIAILMKANAISYEPTAAVDDVVAFDLEFNANEGGIEPGVFLLGLVAQSALASATNTRTGTTNINLDITATPADTAEGAVGHFVVTSGSGAGSSIDATIWHGDGTTYTELMEFASVALAGAPSFERMTVTGTVESHVYAEIVLTAGGGAAANWTAAVAFARLF